jgi:hypothetical protein
VVAPPVVAVLTYAACRELQRTERAPLRVRRTASGGFTVEPERRVARE